MGMEGLLNFPLLFPLRNGFPYSGDKALHKVNFQSETSKILTPLFQRLSKWIWLLGNFTFGYWHLLADIKIANWFFLRNTVPVQGAYGFMFPLCHMLETLWFKLVASKNHNFKNRFRKYLAWIFFYYKCQDTLEMPWYNGNITKSLQILQHDINNKIIP